MKAEKRIMKYGVEAFIRMLTPRVVKERGGRKALLKYYTEKYPRAPLELPVPSRGVISRRMIEYWKDVKRIVKGRKLGIVKARKLMKREGAGRDVSLRVIKEGEGWQLTILGKFRDEKTGEVANAEGYSYTHTKQDYAACFNECIRKAQGYLGGTNWLLIELLEYKWNRFYGREAGI